MYLIKLNSGTIHKAVAIVGVEGKHKKAPAGQSRGSNALSQQHGFYCVTQYHNSMVRKGSVLYDFFSHKKAAYASRTSSPKVKHLIHLVNQCTAKVLKIP